MSNIDAQLADAMRRIALLERCIDEINERLRLNERLAREAHRAAVPPRRRPAQQPPATPRKRASKAKGGSRGSQL